jgi:hypothetical protein
VVSASLLEVRAELCELMMEACEVLSTAAAATATELRTNVKSVTGCAAMASCVDDSLKELLEDIRREDAGLPPLERPPSITSYENQADGSVRVVKTVYPLEPVRLPTAMKNA